MFGFLSAPLHIFQVHQHLQCMALQEKMAEQHRDDLIMAEIEKADRAFRHLAWLERNPTSKVGIWRFKNK